MRNLTSTTIPSPCHKVSIHCVQLMHIAFDAAERARVDAQRPNALTLDSITAIVIAAAAAEAFINELAEDIELVRTGRTHFDPDPTLLDDCAAAVLELEETRGTTVLRSNSRILSI